MKWFSWLKYLSPKLLIIPPLVVGVVIFGLVALAKKELPREDAAEIAIPVSVQTVQPRKFQLSVTGYGTAAAHQTWTSVSEVKGRVVEVHPQLDSGSRIAKEDVLFQIDPRDYELRMGQRRSDLESANASVAELEASELADKESLEIELDLLAVNQREADRIESLLAKRAVSPSDLDNALGVVLRQKQQVQQLKKSISLYPSKIASAKAAAKMADLRFSEAQRDLQRCVVRAPFSGVLAGVRLEKNQVVGQNERLFDLLQVDRIEIESQFSLSQLSRLKGQRDLQGSQSILNSFPLDQLKVEVTTRSGGYSVTHSGRATRIAGSVSEQTRTLGIVIAVDNEFPMDPTDGTEAVAGDRPEINALKPGTFCEVRLIGETIDNAILIPRVALDGDRVFVVDGENRLRRREVKIGMPFEREMLIRSGLEAGDLLVIRPPTPAIDGKLVSPEFQNAAQSSWQESSSASAQTQSEESQ